MMAVEASVNPDQIGSAMGRRIVGVIVTFNPDMERFRLLFDSIAKQVPCVVVVDNGSRPEIVDALGRLCLDHSQLCRMPDNVGIAAAQNRGIEISRSLGASDVLLLDHDSLPADGMVGRLVAASIALANDGQRVGAVGPLIVDADSGTAAPVPQIRAGRVAFTVARPAEYTACEYLIASGMLVPLAVLDAVGIMNERYFIDQVDVEWCSRARRAGYAFYAVADARMEHSIGDHVLRYWLLDWRQVTLHSPQRDFYYFRNSTWMILSSHVSGPWRRFWFKRLVGMLFIQSIYARPRLRRLNAMLSGAFAAFREKSDAAR